MGLLNLTLPTLNDPRGGEEIDVRNALSAIQTEFNGHVDENNLDVLLGALRWGASRGSPDAQIVRTGPGVLALTGTLNALTAIQIAGTPLASTHLSDTALLARLAGPTFTGSPASTTPAVDDNSTRIATTAFVLGQLGSATPTMAGTGAAGTSTRGARQDHVHPTDTSRAPLASPTFTGIPAAPTAAPGTNTTQLATTAFVKAAVDAVGAGGPYAPVASPTFTGTVTIPTSHVTGNETIDGNEAITGNLTVNGNTTLGNDGGDLIGFYGHAPAARPPSWSGVTPAFTSSRSFNPNTVGVTGLAQSFSTLLEDLKGIGLLV